MRKESPEHAAERLREAEDPNTPPAQLWALLGATPGQAPPNEIPPGDQAIPEPQAEVVMLQHGTRWSQNIQIVREHTKQSISRCRDLIQRTPSRLGSFPIEKARTLQRELTQAGSQVVLQAGPWPYPLDLCRALARHPSAQPELLVYLSRSLDPETLAALAEHPSTPPPVLWGLGLQYPEAFWRNPAQWLWLLSDPGLESLSTVLLFAFLRVAPDSHWPMLVEASLLRVAMRHTLASHFLERLSETVRAQLCRDPEPVVRSKLSEWTDRPEELSLFASDPDESVRCGVARNPNVSEAMLWSLLEPRALSVWRTLAARDPSPPGLAEVLIARAEELGPHASTLYEQLSENESLPAPAFRALLAKDGLSPDTLLRLVESPVLPEDCAEIFADHHNSYLRRSLAERHDLPLRLFSVLLDDENRAVRRAARANPRCPRKKLAPSTD